MDLSILEGNRFSYTAYHTMCGPLQAASFASHRISKVTPCYSMCYASRRLFLAE